MYRVNSAARRTSSQKTVFTRRVETVKLADQTSRPLLSKLMGTGSPTGSLVGDRLDARPLTGAAFELSQR